MTYFMIYVEVLLLVSFIDVLLFARYWEPRKTWPMSGYYLAYKNWRKK